MTEAAATDAASVRNGSSIRMPDGAIPPGVDPNGTYAPARSIAMLLAVGKLTADERAVVERADQMVGAHATKDGRVSVDELALLAAPEHIVVLSPAERAALESVWRVMKAPAVRRVESITLPSSIASLTAVPPRPTFRPPTDRVRPPPRTRFRIDESLVGDARETAVRVEYGFDVDGDDATIDLADIDAALLSPAFTAGELELMKTLRRRLADAAETEADQARDATPKTMAAELELPPDGDANASVASVPVGEGLVYRVQRVTNYRDERRKSVTFPLLDIGFAAEQVFSYAAEADGFVVVELGDESVAAHVTPATDNTFELWAEGAPRARVFAPASPALQGAVVTPLAQYIGFRYRAGERDLSCFYERTPDGRPIIQWSSTALEHPCTKLSGHDRLFVERTKQIPPGRYELTIPSAEGAPPGPSFGRLDVYPEGAVVLTAGAETLFLAPDANGTRWAQGGETAARLIVPDDGSWPWLKLTTGGTEKQARLNPAKRTGW